MATIALDDLRKRLREPGLALVNVLPSEWFRVARISGSINIPIAELPARARELLPDAGQDVIVYCGGPT